MASNNHAPRELVGLSLRLHELAIHTGDLKHSCLGCGYEHDCGIHGCALLREAAERLQDIDARHSAHFVHDGPRFAHGVDWWHCSNCGRLASGVETRFGYCPWCGARMDGNESEAR